MHSFLPGALLLAVFMMLTGVSTSAPVADLQLLWSQPVRAAAIVEAAGSARVYVAGGASVSAYDAETGERLWRAATGGRVSRLAADEHRAYTLTGNGLLRTFAGTGDLLWQRSLPAGGLGLHLNAVTDDLLLAGSIWERLTAFDPVAGTELWRTDNPSSGTGFSLAGPVLIAQGTESGAITRSVIRALDAGTGEELWVRRDWSLLGVNPERAVFWRPPDAFARAPAGTGVATVDLLTGAELSARVFTAPASSAWLGGGMIIAARNGSVPLSETPLSHLGPGVHCCFVRQLLTAPLEGDAPLSVVGHELSGSSVTLHVSWPHAWLSRQWENPAPLLRLDLRTGEMVQVAELPGSLHRWTATADALLLVTEEGGLGRLDLAEPALQFSQIPGKGPGSSAVELSAWPGGVLVRYPEWIHVYRVR